MADYKTTLDAFFNRRIGFQDLHDGLDRAVAESPESVPPILAALDEYYRAGDLPIQLWLALRDRVTSQSGQAGEGARLSEGWAEPASATSTAPSPARERAALQGQEPHTRSGPSRPQTTPYSPLEETGHSRDGGRQEPAGQDMRPPVGVGTTLNSRFILEEVIARSSMGVIYRARDLREEEAREPEPYLAIEILNADVPQYPDTRMALRKAKKTQGLAHPNIATVFDCDRDDDTVYTVMEPLEGETLHQFMERRWLRAALAPNYAMPIIEAMAQGLAHIHRRGIVHGSFSPENIFLTRDGGVKVLDVGMAAVGERSVETRPAMTAPERGPMGARNPVYASCEMLEGQAPDSRDDIYGLACMAYELLAGRHPFNGMPATAARDERIRPLPIKDLGRRQFRALLNGLAFERKQRTLSVSRFLEELMPSPRHGLPVSGWTSAIAWGCFGAILAGIATFLLVPTPRHAPGLLDRQEHAPVSATGRGPASLPEQPQEPIAVNWPTDAPGAEATATDLPPPINNPGDARSQPESERVAQTDDERQVPQMPDREVLPQPPQPVEQETQVPDTPGPRETLPAIAAPQAKQTPNVTRAPMVKSAEAKRSPTEIESTPRRSTRAAASSAGAASEDEPALGFASEQIEDLYRRAMRGNPKAEFDLAQRYADGHDVPEDSAEAMKWFRRAAEHGSTGAQVNIGLMYAYGYGVQQDYAEAMRWFRRAAAQGNADAFFNIGTLYKDGLGVPQDLDEAAKWYRRAAGRGVEDAEDMLESP